MRAMKRYLSVLLLAGAALAQAQPQFGPTDPDFAPVDAAARDYLNRYGQPGVSVVVAYGDRIIYAQGYGHADRERTLSTSPWLEYRLAGLSQTFSAAAVMRLVESGKLSLEASAWDLVRNTLGFLPNDERFRTITVRQLLTHSWGLDRSITADTAGSYFIDAGGFTQSASSQLLARWLFVSRLNFDPGARYAYNYTGYNWLQRIAELIDGRPLDQQISELLGAEKLSSGRVRFGKVLPSQITETEPDYYDVSGAARVAPIPKLYPAPEPATVPRPYGAYTLEGYGGSGGLVASAFTVTRFVQRLQGIRAPALLKPETWAQMQTEQLLADGTRNVGLGLQTFLQWPDTTDRLTRQDGTLQGARTGWVSAARVRGGPKVTVVTLVNGSRTWATDPGGSTDDIHTELVNPLLAAVDAIGAAVYSSKPEIGGDRLIAWDTPTETYYIDLLLDWGQLKYPEILKGTPVAGTYDGYRYRYYAATKTYVGMKQGRIYLYQPDVWPDIQFLATMGEYLPQAMREVAAVRPVAAARREAR